MIPLSELAIICHYGSLTDADLSYGALGAYATAHEISVDGRRRHAGRSGMEDRAWLAHLPRRRLRLQGLTWGGPRG